MLVDMIVGARPNFMKVAPIAHEIARRAGKTTVTCRIVHTGQHYDERMSGNFFRQLGIPEPEVNLLVGSGSQAEQTAAIMVRYEKLLLEAPCDLCLVVGDVNSTLACAIAAQKLRIPVAHVEAGIRSGDWTMPEEINRLATDAISNWFFTTSQGATDTLLRSGVADSRIHFVGNTMIDALLSNIDRLIKPAFFDELALEAGGYFVMTLHRPSNVDRDGHFARLLKAIGAATRALPVIYPAHPRTVTTLQEMADIPSNIQLVEPQGYLEFNYLVRGAKAVITDSGGITEECTVMGVPCLTLRDSTERPETVEVGTNELIGTDPAALRPALDRLFAGSWKEGGIPDKWDGRAAERIVDVLETLPLARSAGS
ncbi:non-hydrolyzing UDP-N-acetylglucosamine 2-epimerase [Devosia sp. CAU 1758]